MMGATQAGYDDMPALRLVALDFAVYDVAECACGRHCSNPHITL
jgi:hypothetical protein